LTAIDVRPLREELPFGARIRGVDAQALQDEDVRRRIRAVYEDRGLIVFEEVVGSSALQLELSRVFGPLRDHPLAGVRRVDQKTMPGVIDLNYHPDDANVVEIDGRRLIGWLPWHFDACYTRELNRGGVLRPVDLPPEGGLTGFADGVQLYSAIAPHLRERFEDQGVLYQSGLMLTEQRYGFPANARWVNLSQNAVRMLEDTRNAPRAIQPAIWTRPTGERVVHVSPWQAAGLHGQENARGDALLEALLQEIYAKMTPYWHAWSPTDMVAWDNWRFVHAVSGHDPCYPRRMQRTTIEGDYGLGRFESEGDGAAPLGAMG
jgi:taurine dioxygenase